MLGADKVVRMPNPIMGAEDFSYVLQKVPGSMMFLGGTSPDRDPATAPANHSNRVVFDEDAMTDGIALYAGMALRHLARVRDHAVGRIAVSARVRRSVTSSNGRSVSTAMPSPTSRPLGGSSSRLQRLAATIRRSARTIT